jgi:hypothetical protein
VTHALLIASWWGALRWVNASISPWPVAAAAWLLGLPLAWAAWRRGLRLLVDPIDLLARVPAALFFFALLAARGRDVAPLVAYATAFAGPWLAITPLALRPARGAVR